MKRILPVFTVLGLALSLWNLYKSSESRQSLDHIARAVSTKYLREFPEDIPDITEFIGQTRHSLVIVVDYAGYGSWSAPGAFADYEQTLMKLARSGKRIVMHIYDEKTVARELENQLRVTDHEFLTQIVDKPKWNAYFSFHQITKPKNPAEWYRMLTDEEEDCLKDLRNASVQVERSPGPFPMFFWLRDDEQAIFTFPAFDPKDPNSTRSVAFYSRDAKFKEVLLANLKRLNRATESPIAAKLPQP